MSTISQSLSKKVTIRSIFINDILHLCPFPLSPFPLSPPVPSAPTGHRQLHTRVLIPCQNSGDFSADNAEIAPE